MGCNGFIGTITNESSSNGLHKWEKGFNVKLDVGRWDKNKEEIWRVRYDGEYEILKYNDGRNIMFTKNDLRTGDFVELKNGDVYQVFKNVEGFNDFLSGIHGGISLDIKNYNNDMEYISESLANRRIYNYQRYDIIKIYRPNKKSSFNIENYDDLEIIFIRQNEIIMTISEIEEKLGISNLKIVKD